MAFHRQKVRRMVALASPLAAAAALACGTITAAEGEVPDASAARIVVEADGGIAAFHQEVRIDSATGVATWLHGPSCAGNPNCPGRDSGSKPIGAEAVRGFFTRTYEAPFRALHQDYGTTTNAADMMTYRITIVANGLRRSVTGDDGTLPDLA